MWLEQLDDNYNEREIYDTVKDETKGISEYSLSVILVLVYIKELLNGVGDDKLREEILLKLDDIILKAGPCPRS